ncbi:NAD-dependent epimerase/dehydratase family protein [Methylobacterium currus]|uniref:NAD-dependent epimerase/dehydratase family protein n=1 Tax=Methylobacterium currus TaxID=2051553 RepID=UPI0013DF9066|nr:NAD-dependent epimerase/dehydratase family protein [Methylobacterium currus]
MTDRILITGAQGFLGRYLAADWLAAEPDAVILGLGRSPALPDTFTHVVHWGDAALPAPLPPRLGRALATPRYGYRVINIADGPALARAIREVRPDIVVHLAAALRDDPPDRLVSTNIGGVVSLLGALRESSVVPRKVILGSSGSVYGADPGREPPFSEEACCAPMDPYAATKRAAEDLGRILAEAASLPVVWGRIFNPVGAGQDERHLCGWLGRQIAEAGAGLRPPSVTVGALDTTRDYIDVRDVARALRVLAAHGQPGRAYNVASGRETSGEDVLAMLVGLGGLAAPVDVVRRPARRGDVARSFADVSRLTALGYRPRHSLRDSLTAVLAYYRACVAARVVGAPGG